MTELVGEHGYLAAVVGLVDEHVAEHIGADRDGARVAIAKKGGDVAGRSVSGVEGFGEEGGAEVGA